MSDDLEKQAAAVDADVSSAPEVEAAAPGAQADQQAGAPLNNPETVAAILKMAVGIVGPMFPSVAQVYTEETIQAVAAVTAPLANKRGWNIGGALGKWAEELAFAGVMIPLGIATYRAVLHDLEQQNQQGEPPPPPGAAAQPVTAGGQQESTLPPITLVRQ